MYLIQRIKYKLCKIITSFSFKTNWIHFLKKEINFIFLLAPSTMHVISLSRCTYFLVLGQHRRASFRVYLRIYYSSTFTVFPSEISWKYNQVLSIPMPSCILYYLLETENEKFWNFWQKGLFVRAYIELSFGINTSRGFFVKKFAGNTIGYYAFSTCWKL